MFKNIVLVINSYTNVNKKAAVLWKVSFPIAHTNLTVALSLDLWASGCILNVW